MAFVESPSSWYSAEHMYDWSTMSSGTRNSCLGAAGRGRAAGRGDHPCRDPSTITASNRASRRKTGPNHPNASISDWSAARFVVLTGSGASRRYRRKLAKSTFACTTNSPTACWRSWSARSSAHRHTLLDAFAASRAAIPSVSGEEIGVEVVYALPLAQDISRLRSPRVRL